MIRLANLLLASVALLTLLAAALVADARQAAGADAMGLVVVPMLLAPRWLALAAALGIAARRSALPWIHASRSVQAAVLLLWLALAGAASFASVIMAFGSHSAAFKPWAFVLAVLVPAAVVAGAARCLNGAVVAAPSPLAWRFAAGALTLVVAAGALAMGRVEWNDARAARAAQEAADADRHRWLAEQQGKLRVLSPQAPLHEWLPWLNVTVDSLREPALAAVRARPTLEQDVAGMLRGEGAPQALRFMWLWMPDAPASLAAPARDAIAALPSWAEQRLASGAENPRPSWSGASGDDEFPPPNRVDLSDMAQAAIVIADKYRASGLDFVTPITAFADVLDRHALPDDQLGSDPTYQPRAFLRTWLKEKPAPAEGSGNEVP